MNRSKCFIISNTNFIMYDIHCMLYILKLFDFSNFDSLIVNLFLLIKYLKFINCIK